MKPDCEIGAAWQIFRLKSMDLLDLFLPFFHNKIFNSQQALKEINEKGDLKGGFCFALSGFYCL